MIYLLHFETPICPSLTTQHCQGWATDLDTRIRQHRLGKGAQLCQVAKERGIGFKLAEVIEGDRPTDGAEHHRSLERQLKRRKNSPQLCPVCSNRRQRV